MQEEEDIAPEPVFRPAKRRKFIRRRQDEGDDTNPDTVTATSTPDQTVATDKDQTTTQSNDNEETTNSPNLVRLRRPNPARKGGIGFSATSRLGQEGGSRSNSVIPGDPEKERVQAMADRFTGNSGQTVDVNKHMMAYIDSEMAKRYRQSPASAEDNTNENPSSSLEMANSISTSNANANANIPGQPVADREPASLGRLHEIDLGQEAKLRNIQRTEAATRKLGTEDQDQDQDPRGLRRGPEPDRKVEDRRNRKRRTSADIERDRLVEEVLRESKLDVYDEPEDEIPLDDQAADDRIAEQFRRDFMDAIQSRRRVRTNTKQTANSKVEPPKGPKLGGSRSARAAMREMQNKTGGK